MDVARALAIVCIVLGHARLPGSLWRFLSFFHVPIFFFISGYFYKDTLPLSGRDFVIRKIRHLYLPFVIYEALFLIVHNYFFALNLYSVHLPVNEHYIRSLSQTEYVYTFLNILLFGATEPAIWGFWFVQSLFAVSIFFFAISWLRTRLFGTAEGFRFLVVVAIFLLGIFLSASGIRLPRSVGTSLVCLIFFYFGVLYQKCEDSITFGWCGFAASIITLVSSTVLYKEQIGVAEHNFFNFPYFVFNALVGIYAVLCLSNFLSSRFSCSLLRVIGTSTFPILAFHIISFKVVAYVQCCTFGYPLKLLGKYPVIRSDGGWWAVYCVAGVGLPTLAVYFARRTKALLRRESMASYRGNTSGY